MAFMLRSSIVSLSEVPFRMTPRCVFAYRNRVSTVQCLRPIQVQAISEAENHKSRLEMRKKLPLSPHVTIYKFPLPAIASITTRITGVALSVGFGLTGLIAFAKSPETVPAYIEVLKSGYPNLTIFAKLCVAFPLTYHYLSGLRHLYWDVTAKYLDLPSVRSSTIVLGASAIGISLVLAFISF